MPMLTDSQTISLFQSAVRAYETLLEVDVNKAAEFADRFGIEPHVNPGCYELRRFYPHSYLAAITAPEA